MPNTIDAGHGELDRDFKEVSLDESLAR